MSFLIFKIKLLSICFLLFQFSNGQFGNVAPPYGPSQFSNIGMINAITVANQSDLLSGGSITIDGIPMVVPRNSYVTLPSISVLWSELFINGSPQLPQFGAPGITWEATVIGNRVGDTYVVGLIYLAQSSVRIVQGFVNAIDLKTGEFWVSGNSAVAGSGTKARLNDPVGRYGIPYSDHPLWTVDAESPSVIAATGYPLCIPRYSNGTDDPLCPLKNRVINGQVPTFIQFKGALARTATDPDPNLMAPIMVGDYITINGVQVGGGIFAVYSLLASLALYTAPRELPAYIRVEEARLGVPAPNNAEQGETRAIAFTTDPSTPMQWYAIDVDPCTGAEKERNLQLTQPLGQNAGDVWGKAIFRLGKVNASPMTKNVGFKLLTGTTMTGNGLEAGVFIQPVFTFIMPELVVLGDPMFPFEFQDFPFLALGSGPFIEALPGAELDAPVVLVGQLDPYPGLRTPLTTPCVAVTPTPTSSGPTTLSTISSATPVLGADIVTFTFTENRGQGVTTYTIQAVSSHITNPLPTLIVTGSGINPLGQSPMTSTGNGNYILQVTLKRRLDTITVTSSHGGQSSVQT
ncbi:hypothetical protein HYALB_00007480 [Hymenoscyphus albidus]|uniref:Uncharacterized protein n=1 Tax=Hymenoscyphus albidus TaxID=595503 RepID=A0A9N9Q541_9HELO|nr:hypothetical protein HYALB_00007480 [Hymenoscyphus albidus]